MRILLEALNWMLLDFLRYNVLQFLVMSLEKSRLVCNLPFDFALNSMDTISKWDNERDSISFRFIQFFQKYFEEMKIK